MKDGRYIGKHPLDGGVEFSIGGIDGDYDSLKRKTANFPLCQPSTNHALTGWADKLLDMGATEMNAAKMLCLKP